MRYQNFVFSVFVGLILSQIGTVANAQVRGIPEGIETKAVAGSLIDDLLKSDEEEDIDPTETFAVGRVVDYAGRSVRSARVILFHLDTDKVSLVDTNSFGYYRFGGLKEGNYLIAVTHRRYIFVMGSMSFTVEGAPVEINFWAERLP